MNPALEAPREEYLGPSALLAFGVHAALAVALVVGVHWQSRAPEVVSVELWRAPPEPVPEPPKATPAPPPPKPVPEVKPEPRIEKPDIALKAPPPKPKPRAAPPKPAPKPKPDDRMAQQLLAQALAREQAGLAADRERDAITAQLAREAEAAQSREMQTWVDKIRDKIRGRLVLPPGLQGNPEALVLVTQLPTGEVLNAKLVISSGSAAYDDAVVRAVLAASPLPKPDNASLFERDLKLTFHPQD